MRIFYKFNGPEVELEFVKVTEKFLMVKYPPNSVNVGKNWKIGVKTLGSWVRQGVIRIEY